MGIGPGCGYGPKNICFHEPPALDPLQEQELNPARARVCYSVRGITFTA